ncbi:MAG: alpha/beta hydrolase [Alterinioella nitratireducens]|uniref:alpha/beta hydrolase n=1 Tax=Alterinioella nitratireducens TaxID=2735915 RepID=UPI00405A0F27
MVSLRQRLSNGVARAVQKPLLALPLPFWLSRMTFELNAFLLYKRPRDLVEDDAALGGVPGVWLTRAGQEEGGVLLFLHGGGFVMGSPRSYRHLVAHLAAETGLRGYLPDYALAPEHPFPAAPDDVLAVYRALLEAGHDPGRIAVAGDSAGGCLAAVLLQDIAREGLPMPAVAALISPATDLRGTAPSLEENRRRDHLLPASWVRRAVAAYLDGRDGSDPRLSPLLGAVSGLPPMIVQVCEGEMLRDDGVRLAEAVREAGGTADLRVWTDVPHVWHLMRGRVPEADRGLAELAEFVRDNMAGTGQDQPIAPLPSQRDVL